MNLTLVASVFGIAVVDSLNPFLFITQLYLLTTPKPAPRILAYIAGVMVVNFIGGLLVVAGLRTLITEFLSAINLDERLVLGLQLLVGIILVVIAWRTDTKQVTALEGRKPRSLQPIHAFVLGMLVMVNELTTALPYLIAIERIAQANMSTLLTVIYLAFYNLIFSLPLLGFLGLFIYYRERFAIQIKRISTGIQTWIPRLMKPLLFILGALAIVHAVVTLANTASGIA